MNSIVPPKSLPSLATHHVSAPYEGFDLAPRYDIDRLVLLVREPAWIYAYWDVSTATRNSILQAISDEEKHQLKSILRITKQETSGEFSYFDVELTPFASSWHVYVGSEYMKLSGAMGYINRDGYFYELVRSLPIEKYGETSESQADVMTITDLYPKNIKTGGTSPQAWMAQNTNIETCTWIKANRPATGKTAHNLDLDVETELIVRGRTNPDAILTINGIQVPTDSAGNFSARFSLEDTTLILPIQATVTEESKQVTVTPVITKNVYQTRTSRQWTYQQEV